jgi:dimethylglycine dehydrogenase
VKKSLALGYVPTALAKDGTRLQVELLGDFYDATVTAKPLYDQSGGRMRS